MFEAYARQGVSILFDQSVPISYCRKKKRGFVHALIVVFFLHFKDYIETYHLKCGIRDDIYAHLPGVFFISCK